MTVEARSDPSGEQTVRFEDRTLNGERPFHAVKLWHSAAAMGSILTLFVVGFIAAETNRSGSGLERVTTLALGIAAVVTVTFALIVLNIMLANRRARLLREKLQGRTLLHCGMEGAFRVQVARVLRARGEPGTTIPLITYEVSADTTGLNFWSGSFGPYVFFFIPWVEVAGIRLEHCKEISGIFGWLILELQVGAHIREVWVRVDSPTARLMRGEDIPRVRALAREIVALSPHSPMNARK